MVSLFQRAAAGLNLTPAERAFLKFIEGLWITALVAALPIVAEALAQGPVNWTVVAHAAIAAGAGAVFGAVLKYAKAQGDPPIEVPVSLTAAGVAAIAPSAPTTPQNANPGAAGATTAFPSSQAASAPTAPQSSI